MTQYPSNYLLEITKDEKIVKIQKTSKKIIERGP